MLNNKMRVIAGSLKSRPLVAPAGLATRPTTDRLRETLFNVLTQGAVDRVGGAAFLDLYAGSGGVGIEAVSRGAVQVTFVEQGQAALAVLGKNLASLGIRRGVTVEKRSVGSYLRRAVEAQAGVRYGVVFLDPPYEAEAEYSQTLELLGGAGVRLLAEGALVVAEHRKKDALQERYGALKRVRELKQGDAGVSFYEVGE